VRTRVVNPNLHARLLRVVLRQTVRFIGAKKRDEISALPAAASRERTNASFKIRLKHGPQNLYGVNKDLGFKDRGHKTKAKDSRCQSKANDNHKI